MIPPERLHFPLVSTSFGSTILLLSTALRVISQSLTLDMTHLVLRQSPFVGLPAVDVFLTSDATCFCTWTGLDYTRWTRGMGSEEEAWKWMTEVEPDSIMGRAWGRLARPRDRTKQDEKRGKPGDLDRFIKWLRSPRSKWYDPNTIILRPKEVPQDSQIGAAVKPTLLDPVRPKLLESRAVAALKHWGKMEEYERGMEERRAVAREMAGRQRKRVEAREKVMATPGRRRSQYFQ